MKQILINDKKIHDPLYPSVSIFLDSLIEKAERTKDPNKIKLAKHKYSDLKPVDLLIENPIITDEGLKACFLTRKTGFCRGDSILPKVPFKLVLDSFNINYKTTETKNQIFKPTLFFVNDKFYIKSHEDPTVYDFYELFGKLFFHSYELELYPRIVNDEIGLLTIENRNIETIAIPIYSYRPSIDKVFNNELLSGFSI